MRPRAEVPVEETWRLEDIFPDDASWEAALEALRRDVDEPRRFLGRLGEGPQVLADCIEAVEDLFVRANRVGAYAGLRLATDGADPAAQAAAGRTPPVAARLQAAFAALRSELLQLPEGTIERYLAAEPRLHPYRRMLEQVVRDRRGALSKETEEALATLGEVLYGQESIYSRVTTADLRFRPAVGQDGQEAPVSLSEFMFNIEMGPDTKLRRDAWASLAEGLARYQHTLAANLAARIRADVLTARLRGYPSAIHMMCESGWSSGEPYAPSVRNFHEVLDVIQTEYAPVARRYARLKKRTLGLDRMLLCDVQANPDPEDLELEFEEAARRIAEAAGAMGETYADVIRRAVDERWIDRAVNEGRVGGAFCSLVYGVHPYVFASWSGGVRSLFMLAHELGHAVHGELSGRAQRYVNVLSNVYSVEGPSTFNELLVGRHLLSTSREVRLRRQVIASLLATYHHNFITHLLEAELLRRLYARSEEDRPLTAQVVGDETIAVLRNFWGDEVELDDAARLNWMRQPHYYDGLYPFTYSVGLAGATVAIGRLETEGPDFAQRWVELLRAGNSLPPVELWQETVGIRLDSPDTIRRAIAHAAKLVEEIEGLFD